ncbi:uncharacterized protein LOC34617390 [Cyclospora cayetanensis]|uniref:Uncharacterized protein LOC34617390 n=1 Tax=Cyclospora cayetanensis TaxID=88456 RepID=A0A6P6S0I2_9EIME|nr:uncharacterized protein LOC34617390 [Cyclospora cayetanensis]
MDVEDGNAASSNAASSNTACSKAEENDDDEEDPIVEVLDVYLRRFDDILDEGGAPSAAAVAPDGAAGAKSKVFVLQFPLRPQGRPYGDHGRLQQVAYRQQQQQLRLSYALHAEGPNFDHNHPLAAAGSTGEQARHASGVVGGGGTTPHVLKSQVAKGSECSYAVGVVRNGILYLTPAQGVLQFKPDFGAFEALQHQQQVSEGAAGALPPKQQQQQLIQHMGEMRTRISHSRQRDIEESEPWIPIETFYDADTPEAFDLLSALFNKDREDAAIGNCTFFDSTTAQKQAQPQEAAQQRRQHCDDIVFASDIVSYLSSICRSQQQNEQSAAAAAASGPLNTPCWTSLPELHAALLLRAVWCAASGFSDHETAALGVSRNCEALAGNSHGGAAAAAATAAAMLPSARQLVSQELPRVLVDVRSHVPGSAARAAHPRRSVAVCASSSWRLKLPPDEAFLSAHPKVAAHFAAFWENRLKEVVKEVHAKREAAESPSTCVVPSTIFYVCVAALLLEGFSSRSDHAFTFLARMCVLIPANGRSTGATTPAQLQLAARGVKAILCEFGGLSLTEIRDKLVETSDELKTLTDDELKHVLRGIALHVQGIWVLNSLGNPQIDEFRSALIRVFSSSSPPKTKSQIIQAIEADLQRRVSLPDFALRKLLREFAKNENGMWIFKGNNSQDAVTGVLALTA